MRSATLSILDVGQGDCIVLHDPESGEGILIDCPTGRSTIPVDLLAALSIKRLRAVVVTHLHLDHYGGIEESLEELVPTPDQLWLSLAFAQGKSSPPAARAALSVMNRIAKRRGIAAALPDQSSTLACDRMHLEVLSPDDYAQLEAVTSNQTNWTSLIVMAELGGFRALFGADAPPAQWQRLIDAGVDLSADFVLFPHHGAEFGADPATISTFLDVVAPSVIGLSVSSTNQYGHPRPETLDILGTYAATTGARLLCTQLNSLCAGTKLSAETVCAGAISVSSDEGVLSVSTSNTGFDEVVGRQPKARCVETWNARTPLTIAGN